jgi:hypothetical protein
VNTHPFDGGREAEEPLRRIGGKQRDPAVAGKRLQQPPRLVSLLGEPAPTGADLLHRQRAAGRIKRSLGGSQRSPPACAEILDPHRPSLPRCRRLNAGRGRARQPTRRRRRLSTRPPRLPPSAAANLHPRRLRKPHARHRLSAISSAHPLPVDRGGRGLGDSRGLRAPSSSLPGWLVLKVGASSVQRTQFLGEFVGELGECLLSFSYEFELSFDVWDCGVKDARLFRIGEGVCPLVAQVLAGFFGFGERDDFLEGEAE